MLQSKSHWQRVLCRGHHSGGENGMWIGEERSDSYWLEDGIMPGRNASCNTDTAALPHPSFPLGRRTDPKWDLKGT